MDFKPLKDQFLFIPFHGCNSIGANIYLYHFEGSWVAVDCGIGFANKRKFPGIDIFVPNISILKNYNIKISALIITHSHEDHIGAVCELYKELDCSIYCTKFSKNFLLEDMKSLKSKDTLDIREIDLEKNRKFKVGPFNVEMVRVTHSTVDCTSLYIKTSKGTVYHTGDWKFDDMPVLGHLTDFERIKEIGKEKPDLLICDSTNILSDKEKQFEGLIESPINELVKKAKHMVVLAMFSSNIARIQTIGKIAKANKRQLVIAGTSLERIIRIAKASDYLLDLDFISAKDTIGIKKNEMLVLSTGCQGEENASLSKMAFDKHKNLRISGGDTVIFSSKIIPGNEIETYTVINQLIEKNVDVIIEKDHFVHVSGHPYRKDLLKLYEMLQPKCLIPMHGDKIMIAEHKKLGEEFGIKKVMRSYNGIVVKIDDKGIEKIGEIKSQIALLDGKRKILEDSNIIQERIRISKDGIIFVSLNLNKKEKIILGKPHCSIFGLIDLQQERTHIKNIEKFLSKLGSGFIFKKKFTTESIRNDIRVFLTNYTKEHFDKKPVLEIIINEI